MRRIFSFIIVTAVLLTACGGQEDQSQTQTAQVDSTAAVLSLLPGRQVSDSVRADVTGDGVKELIIVSRSDSIETDPLMNESFDRVDIFETSSIPYRTLFFDLVDFGTTLAIEDVTGDGISDVLVQLDAGGNNPISARGMHLYGRDTKGRVTLLFYSPSGAPKMKDLDDDGIYEIMVSDQFWGMMAHSEVIGFTREIYAFDGDAYVQANLRFGAYFDGMIRSQRRSYERAKEQHTQSDEARSRLFSRMAEYLVWSWARGGAARTVSVWRSENEFLRGALHEEQFDELEGFVEEANTMEHEQSNRRNS